MTVPAIGIVGAGRTRQGLGPFLANWFEKCGARISGIAGRDLARTRLAASAMSQQLGHPVIVEFLDINLALDLFQGQES